MKRGIQTVQKAGALGVKVQCSGRLGGAEMSRKESVPRGPRAAAHAARRHRLRLPRGAHLDRTHRRQGLDLQGRHPALQGLRSTRRSSARPPWPSARPRAGRRRRRPRRLPKRLVTAGGGRRRVGGADGRAGRVVEAEVVAEAARSTRRRGGRGRRAERDRVASPTWWPRRRARRARARLAAEEEIERRTAHEHHETPHFKKEAD